APLSPDHPVASICPTRVRLGLRFAWIAAITAPARGTEGTFGHGSRAEWEPHRPTTPRSPAPMRVLITNDDGIDSAGLTVLAHVAADAGHEVVVAAPNVEYSGFSAGLRG